MTWPIQAVGKSTKRIYFLIEGDNVGAWYTTTDQFGYVYRLLFVKSDLGPVIKGISNDQSK